MFQKFWDPDNKYGKGQLKEYHHWLLELSYRQHTLGCYVIFAKRPVENFSDLTPEELIELPIIQKEVEKAILRAFHPNRFNYAQLGNSLSQLHFHGIPRYATPRQFASKVWEDATYGHPPIWTEIESKEGVITSLRDHLLPYIPK